MEITDEAIRIVFAALLGRSPSDEEVAAQTRQAAAESLSLSALAQRLGLSSEALDLQVQNAYINHGPHIHFARLKLVRTALPKADIIIDLGGANSALNKLGYPHPFRRMTVVDLPPDKRHELYAKANLEKAIGDNVFAHYGDMTNLREWKDNSVDLVWSGQSIEHVPEDAAMRMAREAFRVLKKGGHFCLDTPNGVITRIHAATIGKTLTNPDHFVEYEPAQLQSLIARAGFQIDEVLGVCHMPRTAATRKFHYEDFVLGEPISADVEGSYIQYIRARKP